MQKSAMLPRCGNYRLGGPKFVQHAAAGKAQDFAAALPLWTTVVQSSRSNPFEQLGKSAIRSVNQECDVALMTKHF